MREAVAVSLPVERRVHRDPDGLHPFFAHLAPEGWLRNRQTAYAEVDREDDFGILLAFGADCIGAVGLDDPGHSHDRVRLRPSAAALDGAAVGADRTISGVQAKILCTGTIGDARPATGRDSAPLIAKYPSADLPDMVVNEATTLDLCRLILGADEVAEAALGMVRGIDGVALLVRRFDRAGSGKLRCEDFAQVLGRAPGRDHLGKYRASYADLGRALIHSAARLIDARRLFKRLVVYVLLGNVDCHLKNWSLLETSRGLRLSPAYDVLNGYIYGARGYTTRFGLWLDPQGERLHWEQYDRPLLLRIADEVGLPRRAAEDVLREVGRTRDAVGRRLDQGLRLNEEQAWAYRATVLQAWERIHG